MSDNYELKSLLRFFNNIEETNNCWNWKGTITWEGYGHFFLHGKEVRAHRFAYELFKGDIPNDLTIDHLCRNRSCVNPNHLEAVSHKENVLRGIGITAINAQKTHCVRGHLLDGENIYARKDGYRECFVCKKIKDKEYALKHKDKIAKYQSEYAQLNRQKLREYHKKWKANRRAGEQK